jgi:hypothetical protein
VRQHKNARQTIFLPGVFYYRAPWKMRTAKLLFAVRLKICARQRLKRTAIIIFPVVEKANRCAIAVDILIHKNKYINSVHC